MAALKIRLSVNVDGNLFDETNLTSVMTKGNKRHSYLKCQKVIAAIYDLIGYRQNHESMPSILLRTALTRQRKVAKNTDQQFDPR